MSSPIRKDAYNKLTGTCRFIDDYKPQNLLHGILLYATINKGKVREIILPQRADLQEFTIVSSSDIPGVNIVPEPVSDQPFMVENGNIEHFGQVIIAVAHQSLQKLKEFADAVIIEYIEENAVTDVKECLDNQQNQFGEIMNICHREDKSSHPENLLEFEEVYYTQHQEQAYLETQGMLAAYDSEFNQMKIIGTMQCPFFVKNAVENIFGKQMAKVVVETSEGIGGAFGGKEDFPSLLAGITALLSYKAKKPVKIILDRKDDILITTKRHPSRVKIKSLVDSATGKLHKINIDYRLDAGAYQTLSPVVLHRGILHATGCYHIPEVDIKGFLHRSNTPPNGAFRGFGAPQALFAIESHIDSIAYKINKNPLFIRQANLLRSGEQLPAGQKINEEHARHCLEKVLHNSNYKILRQEIEKFNAAHKEKRGVGLALGLHGGGYTGNGEKILQSEVKIILEKNADIGIYVANVEMGQGAHTTLAQMVSNVFKIPLSKVNVIIPNTSQTPNSGPTVASRTIYIVGSLLEKLAQRIKKELSFSSYQKFATDNQELFPAIYTETFQPDPADAFDEETNQGTAYHDYSWAACVVEISYDPDIYQIKVEKCWNVLDAGRIINDDIARGQVYGGVTQALGWALSENIYKKGYPRIRGLTDYVMPASVDTPQIFVEFIHTDSPTAKGLGEIPMDYPAPAVRNALLHALNLKASELPLSPERIHVLLNRG